jgi:hypothetical protein
MRVSLEADPTDPSFLQSSPAMAMGAAGAGFVAGEAR